MTTVESGKDTGRWQCQCRMKQCWFPFSVSQYVALCWDGRESNVVITTDNASQMYGGSSRWHRIERYSRVEIGERAINDTQCGKGIGGRKVGSGERGDIEGEGRWGGKGENCYTDGSKVNTCGKKMHCPYHQR